jgi:hypothetical protein
MQNYSSIVFGTLTAEITKLNSAGENYEYHEAMSVPDKCVVLQMW